MKRKISGYALAMAMSFGAGAALSSNVSAGATDGNTARVLHGTDAAFRDGLYMGKHDAEEGRLHHVAAGRWSADADRTQYEAGYDAGFDRIR
ncbi:hypothetical protein Acid345_3060 [Candidatus Koribacter versatilis Ellin345]|uniref:Uncharacterized protein n=1 Tax=Koribacter versatilis (strain Ellin345) TaxID=204669 RepID=Q1IM39_KORVE|nr:hypothetical protein [Candidatus Koribacter versatilis]ABF42061.1 hypothetical protein Acid345_3060 [Candidatus Koribacter versatilis Ellin345]